MNKNHYPQTANEESSFHLLRKSLLLAVWWINLSDAFFYSSLCFLPNYKLTNKWNMIRKINCIALLQLLGDIWLLKSQGKHYIIYKAF